MPSPYTSGDARTWIDGNTERAATGKAVTWAIADPVSDLMLGAVNVFDVTEHDAEVGYWTHPDARGRGTMRAAVGLVTRWSFAELGVRRLRLVAAVDNAASRHVAVACGYTLTGEERLGTVLRTGLADVVLYDLLAEESSRA